MEERAREREEESSGCFGLAGRAERRQTGLVSRLLRPDVASGVAWPPARCKLQVAKKGGREATAGTVALMVGYSVDGVLFGFCCLAVFIMMIMKIVNTYSTHL